MSVTISYCGGCLCGALRYEAAAAPLNVRACHCAKCRKASGAMMYARAVFAADTVRRNGEVARYRSSERMWRLFCPNCGTLVFGEPVDRPDLLAISLASLDDVEALAPQMHIWTSAKPHWLMLCDGLPEYPEGAPL